MLPILNPKHHKANKTRSLNLDTGQSESLKGVNQEVITVTAICRGWNGRLCQRHYFEKFSLYNDGWSQNL